MMYSLGSRFLDFTHSFDPGKKLEYVLSSELPLEWLCSLLVAFLKPKEAVLGIRNRIKVIRCQHLTLHHGEVNLDLVQPAGVDRGVHAHDVLPLFLQSMAAALTTMR